VKLSSFVDLLTYAEPICCVVALVVMQFRGQLSKFKSVALLLLTRVTSFALVMPLLYLMKTRQHLASAYSAYFYIYWISYALEAILGFFIIFGIYNLAMAPLPGLKKLGMLMFRWAAGIAVAIAVTMAFGPHVTANKFIIHAVTQLQQTQSVLTLCMLLFVCLAIRPMGLSYGSKIFGVSLGLGIVATTDLVGSAWLSHFSRMYSAYNVVNGLAILATLSLWTGYFAMPEPKRRMIVLPTTSPFLRWNQISMALGDAPGFVALGEVSPDMFAPAEVEIMRRASVKMRAVNS
jgi:hypothetical protein